MKRLLSVIAIVTLAAPLLAGCGGGADPKLAATTCGEYKKMDDTAKLAAVKAAAEVSGFTLNTETDQHAINQGSNFCSEQPEDKKLSDALSMK